MWLFTKYGFFSIVKDFNDSNMYLCRARRKKDLENLFPNLKCLKEIHINKKADYHYRIFIDKEELLILLTDLSNNLNYSNFKAWVSKSKDQADKTEYYSEVWEVMESYQEN